MGRIKEIVGCEDKGSYALVHVIMEDGLEAVVYVGGECETYFHKGRATAFVKKTKTTIDIK